MFKCICHHISQVQYDIESICQCYVASKTTYYYYILHYNDKNRVHYYVRSLLCQLSCKSFTCRQFSKRKVLTTYLIINYPLAVTRSTWWCDSTSILLS